MRLPATLVICCLTTLPAIARNAARESANDAAVREIVRKYVDARSDGNEWRIAAIRDIAPTDTAR